MSDTSSARFIYFVTGAAGFIGANLLESLLKDNCAVHILLKEKSKTWRIDHLLAHKQLNIHYGSIEDKHLLRHILLKVKPDIIYHLATRGAYSVQDDPDEIFLTNFQGTLNLLETAKEFPVKLFVNTSSSSEYGSKNLPMKESDRVDPDSFYAVSKTASTLLSQFYAKKFQLPVITFRLFSIYGPWEEPGRLMPTLLMALKNRKSLDMVSPETARDFVYIRDLISLYRNVELLMRFPGKIFNLGTGKQSTIREVTQIASKISGQSIEFMWQKMSAKSWDKNTWVADMSLTEKELGWRAETTVEDGLSLMWEWITVNHRFY